MNSELGVNKACDSMTITVYRPSVYLRLKHKDMPKLIVISNTKYCAGGETPKFKT